MVMLGCIFYYVYVVFFFKQKTAYEMRISDWSSDVCSSDLPRLGIEQISREPPGPLASEPPGGTPLRIEVEKGDAVAALLREIPGEVGGEKGLADQIGRASCRERVCQ